MFNKKAVLASLAILAAPFSTASASNFGYSYLGIDLVRQTLDESFYVNGYEVKSLGGLRLSGSLQATDNIAILFTSTGTGAKSGDDTTEVTFGEGLLGLSLIAPANDKTDLIFGFALLSSEAEICVYNYCSTTDDSGTRLSLDVRHALSESIELNGGVENDSYDDANSFTTYKLGAAFSYGSNSAVRMYFTNDSDSDSSVNFGYRYTF